MPAKRRFRAPHKGYVGKCVIEREYIGRGRVWLDCSCGWFHSALRMDESSITRDHLSGIEGVADLAEAFNAEVANALANS